MDRRTLLSALALFPLLSLADTDVKSKLASLSNCPICGSPLVAAGSIKIDESLPSPNLELWNGSYHGDFWPFYGEESRVCSRCYAAYNADLDKWERSSEIAESFYLPLLPEIAEFPLSSARVKGLRTVYSQEFKGVDGTKGRKESVSYWAHDSMSLRSRLSAYAKDHFLEIAFDTAASTPGEVFVNAETPN